MKNINIENTSTDSEIKSEAVSEIEGATEDIKKIVSEIKQVIYGQDNVIHQVMVTLLAGGHGLLVGVPGLAKTLLVETLGTVLGLNERRIQFTPDLLPTDILGSEILEEDAHGKRAFKFIEGPVFCQLLMADEINRASPRTQSALLQAMQEHHVTTAGETRKLPSPFHVLATQNPIEQEGTYPLPEAQLDRFFMQINIDYPDLESEREILIRTTGIDTACAKKVIDGAELIKLQQMVRQIPVGKKVVDAILHLVRSLRPEDNVDTIVWGPGPRAAQFLMLGCRAQTLLEGRMSPSIDDVVSLSAPILRHRMSLSFKVRAEGLTIDKMIRDIAEKL